MENKEVESDVESSHENEQANVVPLKLKELCRHVLALSLESRIDETSDSSYDETEQSSSDSESDNSLSDDLDILVTPDDDPENVESDEDWDSDSYWEPSFLKQYYVEMKTPWKDFMLKKMMEGNICSIDLHQPTILDKIMYNRQIQNMPVEGQFDDLSDDDDDDDDDS